jgi:hypothetical protein
MLGTFKLPLKGLHEIIIVSSRLYYLTVSIFLSISQLSNGVYIYIYILSYYLQQKLLQNKNYYAWKAGPPTPSSSFLSMKKKALVQHA